MSAVAVRPARPSDREAVIDLVLTLNLFENALSSDRTTDRASAVRRYEEHLATLRRDETAALLVAELGGRVAGYLFFVVEIRPVFVREELRRVGYVAELCVAAGARRSGIGRALLAEAEALGRRREVAFLGLTALQSNAPARQAYRRAGFEDYAVEMLKPLRPRDEG